MEYKELLELVAEEAALLRKNATPQELAKLDLYTLDPSNANRCIYGLMTGDCTSPRAESFIRTCCKKYVMAKSKSLAGGLEYFETTSDFRSRIGYVWDCFSPIELYISLRSTNPNNLISYLTGETDNIELRICIKYWRK